MTDNTSLLKIRSGIDYITVGSLLIEVNLIFRINSFNALQFKHVPHI